MDGKIKTSEKLNEILKSSKKWVDAFENTIKPLIEKLEESGCKIKIKKDEIELNSPKKIKAVDIKTMPYPRFSNRFAINNCNIFNNSYSEHRLLLKIFLKTDLNI